MTTSPHCSPPEDFADPRRQPDFQPECWPLCDGQSAPLPDSPDLHERRCLEFLAAFYRLNVINRKLVTARSAGAAEEAVRAVLSEVAGATTALETLEDRYAPIGFYGEPVMDGIRYGNIVFARPGLSRNPAGLPAVASHVAIPGLEEIPDTELQGPVKVFRWGHGKVDL